MDRKLTWSTSYCKYNILQFGVYCGWVNMSRNTSKIIYLFVHPLTQCHFCSTLQNESQQCNPCAVAVASVSGDNQNRTVVAVLVSLLHSRPINRILKIRFWYASCAHLITHSCQFCWSKSDRPIPDTRHSFFHFNRTVVSGPSFTKEIRDFLSGSVRRYTEAKSEPLITLASVVRFTNPP